MKTTKLRSLLFFLGLIGLSGCTSYTRVVTNNSDYKGDYKEGQKYELLQDAFFIDTHELFFFDSRPLRVPRYVLQVPNGPEQLPSVEEYQKDPKKWSHQI